MWFFHGRILDVWGSFCGVCWVGGSFAIALFIGCFSSVAGSYGFFLAREKKPMGHVVFPNETVSESERLAWPCLLGSSTLCLPTGTGPICFLSGHLFEQTTLRFPPKIFKKQEKGKKSVHYRAMQGKHISKTAWWSQESLTPCILRMWKGVWTSDLSLGEAFDGSTFVFPVFGCTL